MPAHAVKGIIGADDRPPEARVSRLDECRLKQKMGYGQDANPTHHVAPVAESALFLRRPHFGLNNIALFVHVRTAHDGISNGLLY